LIIKYLLENGAQANISNAKEHLPIECVDELENRAYGEEKLQA